MDERHLQVAICGESGITSSDLLFEMWIMEEKISPLVTPRCEGVTNLFTMAPCEVSNILGDHDNIFNN